MALATGVVALAVCGAEVVQVATGAELFVMRETGNGTVGEPCTLSPAVKMQRAMSTLQTILLWCSVPSWMRLEKSFLGLTKCFGAPAAPLRTGWATGGAGTPGATSPGSFGVWRRKAKWRWRSFMRNSCHKQRSGWG